MDEVQKHRFDDFMLAGFHEKKVNALRHSYLTDKYKQYSEVDKELSKDMSE